jgi:hypothetical protein
MGDDFGVATPAKYEAMGDRFLTGDLPPGALEQVRPNGDVVRFNPATDEFGRVEERRLYDQDILHSRPAVHGYPSNLEYFHAPQ